MATIRELAASDWRAVEAIYREGIATGNATFEPVPPSWEEFDTRRLLVPRLVAVDRGKVVGWAAASHVSSRSVYDGVVEHSVYVSESVRDGGVGSTLLAAFLDASERAGIWTVQSGLFPENAASLALHRKLGFREVGYANASAR